VRAGQRATSKDDRTNGTGSLFVSDARVAALRFSFDSHFRNDGNAHACTDHAEKAAELSAFKNNLWVKTRAVACGNSRIAEAMAVAQQQERLGAQVFQRECAAFGEFVIFGERGEQTLRKQRSGLEFVAADGECEDGDVDGAPTETIEKNGRDFFHDRELYLGKFSGERSKDCGQVVRSNGRDDADANPASHEVLALDDVATRGFEFVENGARARKESFAEIGEPHGASEPVEETRAKLIFQLYYLLRKRRLRDVGLFRGTAEAAGFRDSAEVAKLMELHRLCLSIVSELYIRCIGRGALGLHLQSQAVRLARPLRPN
jgi:hypothetical protein